MNDRPVSGAERPRREPEIIPPGDPGLWPDGSFRATHHVYVARLGPFGVAMAVLAVAFLAAVIALLLLGAFLIWLPLAGLILAIAILSSVLRGSGRRRV
jgi:hypothetical protein